MNSQHWFSDLLSKLPDFHGDGQHGQTGKTHKNTKSVIFLPVFYFLNTQLSAIICSCLSLQAVSKFHKTYSIIPLGNALPVSPASHNESQWSKPKRPRNVRSHLVVRVLRLLLYSASWALLLVSGRVRHGWWHRQTGLSFFSCSISAQTDEYNPSPPLPWLRFTHFQLWPFLARQSSKSFHSNPYSLWPPQHFDAGWHHDVSPTLWLSATCLVLKLLFETQG